MQRDNELPEGTDHIINGAMETGTPSSAGTQGSTGSSGNAPAFIGADAAEDDTGGTADGGRFGQLREGALSLKSQATEKARGYADESKAKVSEAFEELSRIVDEAAGSIDERLGAEYGAYARRAAGAVSNLATTLRDTEIDEIYEGAQRIVRKSPVVAIGTAAVVGFALVRLVKAGLGTGADDESAEAGSANRGRRGNRNA